jgi:hypothetical protein
MKLHSPGGCRHADLAISSRKACRVTQESARSGSRERSSMGRAAASSSGVLLTMVEALNKRDRCCRTVPNSSGSGSAPSAAARRHWQGSSRGLLRW